ncbi:phosphomevalonate kinase, partial [Coemansia sp. RSA 2703]
MSQSADAVAPEAPVTLASAPGKVLVAGGYLVLDRRYSGLVVGTDACLYAAVKSQPRAQSSDPTLSITVRSPQFESAWWRYAFDRTANTLRQDASADGTENTFVHVVLETTLALANSRNPAALQAAGGLSVALLADNDFYSQRQTLASRGLSPTPDALATLPRMCSTGTTLAAVHKTGLGSSAAMVTSLVAALLAHLRVTTAHPLCAADLRVVHNVAQLAHCLAQGKVGSGFDVSAAVHGSHVYRRFTPALLDRAMSTQRSPEDICAAADAQWDCCVERIDVPPRL